MYVCVAMYDTSRREGRERRENKYKMKESAHTTQKLHEHEEKEEDDERRRKILLA